MAYSIVWKYKIIPAKKEKFEFEYGPIGTWSQLFSQSKDYKGSFLHVNDDEPETYLLIDTWTGKKAYALFLEKNKDEYHRLGSESSSLYESEEKIGTFHSVS